MGTEKHSRFGMADGLTEFRRKQREDFRKSQHDQDIDFNDIPDITSGYHTSEIREMVRTSTLATVTELEGAIRGERPGSNLDTTETNLQTATVVTSEPTPSLPPLPVSPLMQRSSIQFPMPVIGDPREEHQRQHRAAGHRAAKQEEQQPPVSMNDEQQDLLAWIVLLERCEALHHARKERKLLLFNQLATFAISILGIVGGCIAIKTGVSSITEVNRR